ncbi:MAG: outer membrane protein assembly factor BamD [Myxococcaceae bacterium]|nr:outer membrane protein assembly factor BamD [Myxococcaceae bacterium]
MKRLFVIFVCLLVSACKGGGFGTFFGGDAAEPSYADDADENLTRGQESLDSKNYVEAQKYFDYVKSKYPYLEAATTAELKLGDVDFEREKYIEARDRYVNFAKLHPTHPKLDYAAFRAALTHYKDMPSDFFVLPPSVEKDQAEVRSASVALADFIRNYPQSSYVEEAKKALDEVRRRLAGHELYVANFYKRRERWQAVVLRLNVVARDFGGLGYEEKVYFGLYDAYLKIQSTSQKKLELGQVELSKAQAVLAEVGDAATDAQKQKVTDAELQIKEAENALLSAQGKPEEVLKQLVERYPETDAAKKAQSMLEKR